MRLPDFLVKGVFLERANRFVCRVEVEGRTEKAHLANSGRLRELLTPGRPVYMKESLSSHRRTHFDMLLMSLDDMLVSVDARLPNDLVEEGLRQGILEPFKDYSQIKREVTFGHSRLDFLLQDNSQFCYLEVKSITLVEQGRGLFPDAPTERGRQHLLSLIQARKEGHQAAIVFVVQRPDVTEFSPNDKTDPAFGLALREAHKAGVGIYAYRCMVTLKEIRIEKEIPVQLNPKS
ncbi:MAG: DNA/RNA nuclease SfsA [Dehalococcoidia bacterium]|nr:DNA/RNA nuclease SfsA [Dehalococcoidia bacterium]